MPAPDRVAQQVADATHEALAKVLTYTGRIRGLLDGIYHSLYADGTERTRLTEGIALALDKAAECESECVFLRNTVSPLTVREAWEAPRAEA